MNMLNLDSIINHCTQKDSELISINILLLIIIAIYFTIGKNYIE